MMWLQVCLVGGKNTLFNKCKDLTVLIFSHTFGECSLEETYHLFKLKNAIIYNLTDES